jgi:RNA polymerase sigma-70 factor (family 1)
MKVFADLSDDELAPLLKEGRHQAFTEIFKRYNHLLYIYAYKKLNDKEEAQDIVQELFVRLWKNHQTFVLRTSLASYLYRSVRNRSLDLFAHKKIKAGYISSFQNSIDNLNATTDYLVREKDISALIDREIQTLPAKMRDIFILSRKYHLSQKEIAIRLDISEETVNKQIKRALRVLRIRLKVLILLSNLFGL